MEINKFVFKHPIRCLLSGPSSCGKTTFIRRVIQFRAQLFTTPPRRIIYTYKYPQAWFSLYPFVEFRRDVPQTLDGAEPSLLVLDDLLGDSKLLKECANLFTRGSHHQNASVFFLSQSLFASDSSYRSVSLNSSHFVLFKNTRGLHQIRTLGRQIFGKNANSFMAAYKDATNLPFGYLLLDVETPHVLRTKIFPNETEEIYVVDEVEES